METVATVQVRPKNDRRRSEKNRVRQEPPLGLCGLPGTLIGNTRQNVETMLSAPPAS